MKKYNDIKWLSYQYNILNKSSLSIASECNVNKTTILNHLKKNKIKIKSSTDYTFLDKKPYMDKKWMEKEYSNKTTTMIARKCNVSTSIILKWLKRFNIKIRSRNERMSGKFHHSFEGNSFLSNGYKNIYCPNHPRIHRLKNKRPYVKEHIIIMEKHLKRFLNKGEEIHHMDGNKLNNDINNLKLFKSSSDHIKYEMLIRDFAKKLLFSNLIVSNRKELLELFNNFQCS